MQVVIKAYENRHLHDTALLRVINLIPKASRNSRFLKNLRPITILNSDYKLVEKAIATK